MSNWMAAEKANLYIKEKNPQTMIGENTLRKLTKNGFPCLRIDSRTLINVDTFEEDLIQYSREQLQKDAVQTASKIRKIS